MFFIWELCYVSLWSDKSTNWTAKNVAQLLTGTRDFLYGKASVPAWGPFNALFSGQLGVFLRLGRQPDHSSPSNGE